MKISRSIILNIKMLNKIKLEKLSEIYQMGLSLTKRYLDIIWPLETEKFASTYLYNLIDVNITARFKQICCKKALDIKRSIKSKVEKKQFIIGKLFKEPFNEEHILKLFKIIKKIDKKPEITNFSLDLNGNFITIEPKYKERGYTNWIHISSLGKILNMNLPYLNTKYFNKLVNNGFKISDFISLNDKNHLKIVLTKEVKLKEDGQTIGCDIGLNKVLSFSSGVQTEPNSLNKELPVLHRKLNRRIKGSKRYSETMNERDCYIKEAINKINFSNIKVLYIEDIKYLRFKKHCSKFLRCWRYALIFQKLKFKCEELGIEIKEANPKNTSRRCSTCGWVSEKNRDGTSFKCLKCSCMANADINGAKNILFIGQNNKKISRISEEKEFFFN